MTAYYRNIDFLHIKTLPQKYSIFISNNTQKSEREHYGDFFAKLKTLFFYKYTQDLPFY